MVTSATIFPRVGATVSPRIEEERYLALLRAANAIATSTDCNSASDTLVRALREVTPFDYLHVVAFDKDTNVACWSLLDVHGERIDGAAQEPFFSLEDSPLQWVHETSQPLVTLDWNQTDRFEGYSLFLTKLGIASTCTLPLVRGTRRLGVFSLGRRYPNAYDD